MKLISIDDKDAIYALIKKAGLPTEIPSSVSLEDLVIKMRTDKKARQGKIRWVLQDGIGAMKTFENGSYSIALEESYILKVLQANF